MIKINKEFNVDVKISFSKIVSKVNKRVKQRKLLNITPDEVEFLNTINKKTIRKLVFSKPKRLKNIIIKIYNKHPIVCEYYSPDYFLRHLNLQPLTNLQLPLKTKENKKIVYNELAHAIKIITSFSQTTQSLILEDILNTHFSPQKLSSLRDKILNLISIKNGGPLKENTIKLFPSWVKNISEIFKYSLIDRETAYQLNSFLDISICPYCNSEEIEQVEDHTGTSYRPAFDHFIPKYKYPLISFSLFNLIPSCTKCNSTYKKSLDPIMTPFSNPFLEGVNDTQLFDFNYDIDYIYRDGQIDDDHIQIILKKQKNNIDENMAKLSIENRYNSRIRKKAVRLIAKRAFDLKAYEENFIIEPTLFATFGYETNIEPLKHMHKKLTQDAILVFCNKQVPLIE
ncbi:hypothetical protein ACQ95F_23195 [Escherichia coli]|uniref:hypothetical protein n=1 Tax=Escherichia coli TaxID=562 RepID=UPI000F95EFF2|nr:hypothetical protein [Escherichia coli]MMK05742.1 hypothetical protein [Shigella sonnei]MCK2233486.1 hypothetical protein [Escherichia coli]MCK2260451.1 hypothetical protein [Escherichia coli]MCY0787093.1 hypothetical protein [Escherichia coli]MDC6766869.1 hypothetical protein [Escherichia coli]